MYTKTKPVIFSFGKFDGRWKYGVFWNYNYNAARLTYSSCTAGVGKLFTVEGRMGLRRACCGPDRYKSHKSTQWTGVCTLAYMFEYDCYVTWSWVSGDPLAT